MHLFLRINIFHIFLLVQGRNINTVAGMNLHLGYIQTPTKKTLAPT